MATAIGSSPRSDGSIRLERKVAAILVADVRLVCVWLLSCCWTRSQVSPWGRGDGCLAGAVCVASLRPDRARNPVFDLWGGNSDDRSGVPNASGAQAS